MARTIGYILILLLLLPGTEAWSQDSNSIDTSGTSFSATSIEGTWVTETGNLVEVTVVDGDVTLYFPMYARYMNATFDGSTLIYETHYNDPTREEIYLDVPDNDRDRCTGFVSQGDPRHRFTLTLSPDGLVLAGTKEINVMHCEWDTDENGNTSNFMPVGFQWEYFSDYQWRRSNCDFSNLPPLNGNVVQKYDLLNEIFDRYGLRAEFSLDNFIVMDRVRFNYAQDYIDADNGSFVPASEASLHQHVEPLDGHVIRDEETGDYLIELFPYAMESYVNLLTGLTMLCHQLNALEAANLDLDHPTTQMEIDSVNYLWSHRQALCTLDDELFGHHVDFLSRALQFRAMAE
jgi:hypothetical protein